MSRDAQPKPIVIQENVPVTILTEDGPQRIGTGTLELGSDGDVIVTAELDSEMGRFVYRDMNSAYSVGPCTYRPTSKTYSEREND